MPDMFSLVLLVCQVDLLGLMAQSIGLQYTLVNVPDFGTLLGSVQLPASNASHCGTPDATATQPPCTHTHTHTHTLCMAATVTDGHDSSQRGR
jgi:hypothetical protein